MKQGTIKNQVSVSGIGLHSGINSTITFKPAETDSGIRFIRTDLAGRPEIKADLNNVSNTERGTKLGNIYTVEHVLSALYGLSITNVTIELDGMEPPALDGSSKPFCELLLRSGLLKQGQEMKVIKLKEPVVLIENNKSIIAMPSDRFRISFMIDYPVVFIGSQYLRIELNEQTYLKEIAPARTYGFTAELDSLKQKGLALGANVTNAIAIGNDGYLNNLRFKNELVRHKMLDLIGDLSLTGKEIRAHIIGIRSSHEMNIKLAKMLLQS